MQHLQQSEASEFLTACVYDMCETDDMEEAIDMGLKFDAVTYLFTRDGKTSNKAHFIINDLREVLKEA